MNRLGACRCLWEVFRFKKKKNKSLTVHRSANAKSSWLVFNGLDTFTTVELCGQFIGTTDNQFRQYTFDVSKALSNCNYSPTLALNFGSAPKIVNDTANDPSSQSKSR